MELALLMLSAAAFPVQVQFFQLLARLYLLSSQNNCESKSKRNVRSRERVCKCKRGAHSMARRVQEQ